MRISNFLKCRAPLLLLFVCSEAAATGETLPISFELDDRHQIAILTADTDYVAAVSVRAELYRNGELVDEYEIDTPRRLSSKGERDFSTVHIALFSERQEAMELKDGAYAEKFIVDGRWKDRSIERPLTITARHYFVVRESKILPISYGQYDKIVDEPQVSMDERGNPVIVNSGRALAEEVPIEKTPLNKDVSLGPVGGLRQEIIQDERSKRESSYIDDSERDED